MRQRSQTKILAIVGLSGSGKTTAADYFAAQGYPKVYFGGVMLKLMERAGVEATPENERAFREKVRRKRGKDVVVNEIIEQIKDLQEAGQHRIMADGLYTWTEYKALKHAFPGELAVVAVVTLRKTRYQRLSKRPIRPFTHEEAQKRDWSEIENLEKGGPIAIADYYVMNNGTIEDFQKELQKVAEVIGF